MITSTKQFRNKINNSGIKLLNILLLLIIGSVNGYSQIDTTAPVITGFNISPQVVDVSNGPADVTLTITARDDLSGLAYVSPGLKLPGGTDVGYGAGLISGTTTNGVWQIVFTIPQYSQPGTATISGVYLTDLATNVRLLTVDSLINHGFDPYFQILSNTPDNTAPVITGFNISPQVVDVSNGPADVTLTITARDDLSGLAYVSPGLKLPGGTDVGYGAGLISGTTTNGVWQIVFTIPQYSQPGTATISGVYLTDLATNVRLLTVDSLINHGFDPYFQILSNTPDNTAPVITGFNISPQVVDVSNGPADVTLTITARDDLSGLAYVSPGLKLPGGTDVGYGAGLISGTTTNGVWQIVFTIPQYSQPGTATISGVYLTDLATNVRLLTVDSLINHGFDPYFQILNTGQLPITWHLPVTGIILNKQAIISWSVSSQLNNRWFEIQHSTDSRNFQTIGIINGDGNNNQEKKYTYIDLNPSNRINYYRVKQVDNDGRFHFSNVASVNYQLKKSLLYPNPAIDKVYINTTGVTSLKIYNSTGQSVNETRLIAGKNEINVASFSKGIYIFKLHSGEVWNVVKE